jgi:peptidoglycan/LPS O-acetylase OafA/YrhL
VVLFHFGAPVSGPLGVVIFFVLSGYLITGILLREHSRTGNISLRDFYMRRALRIFPAFYVAWILDVAIRLGTKTPIDPWHAFGSFFYLGDYVRALDPKSLQNSGPVWISWSLAIEEKFYLLWPVALVFILKRKRDPRYALLGFILFIWVWRAFLLWGLKATPDYMYNAFDCRAGELAIGCFAAFIERLQRLPAPAVWGSVAFLVFASCFDYFAWGNPGSSFLVFTLQPLAAVVLLLSLAAATNPILAHPAIATLARLSYSLYLYHSIVPDFVWRFPQGTRKVSAVLLIVGLTLGSWYFVEKPFLAIRDRMARRNRDRSSGRMSPVQS